MIAETLEANGKSRVRGLYDDFRSSKRRRRNGRRQSVDFFITLNLNYKKYFLSKIYASSFYVYFFNQKNNFTYLFYFLPHDPPPSSNIGFKPYEGVEPHHAPPLSLRRDLRLDLRRDLRLDLRRDLRLDLRRDLRLDLRRDLRLDLRRDFLQ